MLLPSGIRRRVVLQIVMGYEEKLAAKLFIMEDCGSVVAAACETPVIYCHTILCIAQDNTKLSFRSPTIAIATWVFI